MPINPEDKVERPHSFRTSDELWRRFGDACSNNYTNRTEKLNDFMTTYVHKYEMSHGLISEEMRGALADVITKLVKKQSMVLLKTIMEGVASGAIDRGEIELASGVDESALRDILGGV